MNKMARCGVFIAALLSLFAVGAASAGAVTWSNIGDTTFTATGGPTTITSTGVQVSCLGSDVTGSFNTSPFVGAAWTAATGGAVFTGGTMAGSTASVTCTFTVTATAWTSGVTSGGMDGRCTSVVAGTLLCTTHGQLPGTYTNPIGTTTGRATLVPSTTLRATGPNCTLGSNDLVTLTLTTFGITNATGGPTPHAGPIITRAP
jgi:hypothetical protein